MTNELYDYIYDAMCWVQEMLDDLCDPHNTVDEILNSPDFDSRYAKLDKAIGRFQRWYYEENNKKD